MSFEIHGSKAHIGVWRAGRGRSSGAPASSGHWLVGPESFGGVTGVLEQPCAAKIEPSAPPAIARSARLTRAP